MPRFFFHVREGSDLSRDREGQEFSDADAARHDAINAGREMLGETLLHGGPVGARQIEIADETGRVVDVVHERDVLMRDGKLRSYSDDVTQSAPVGKPLNTPRT
jgi:hypothetical protein